MFNEYFGVIVGTWYQNVQIDKRRMLTLQIISYLVRSTCHYFLLSVQRLRHLDLHDVKRYGV